MNPSEVEQLRCHNGSLVTYFDIPGAGSDIAFHSRPCELLHCGGCWGSSSFGSCLKGGFWRVGRHRSCQRSPGAWIPLWDQQRAG